MQGNRYSFAAGVHVKLCENGGNVVVDCFRRDKKALSDFGVGESIAHQRQHVHLPVRKSGGVFFGAWSWPTRNAAHAGCAHRLA